MKFCYLSLWCNADFSGACDVVLDYGIHGVDLEGNSDIGGDDEGISVFNLLDRDVRVTQEDGCVEKRLEG